MPIHKSEISKLPVAEAWPAVTPGTRLPAGFGGYAPKVASLHLIGFTHIHIPHQEDI